MGKIKYEDDLSGYGIASDDRQATIVSFSDYDATEIHIPAYTNGVPVRRIGFGAFKAFDNLQFVYLPDTIRTIDSSAFRSCPNLEKAVLSKHLETQIIRSLTAVISKALRFQARCEPSQTRYLKSVTSSPS